jgi:MFS family permease
MMMVSTVFENTTIDGLFTKNLPKEIRGSLNGVYNFFGNFGVLLFSKLGGYLYDSVGPSTPFMIVIVADVVFASFIIVLKLCGKFN